jgi:hypothetical protein
LHRRTYGANHIDAQQFTLVGRRTAHIGENVDFFSRRFGDRLERCIVSR